MSTELHDAVEEATDKAAYSMFEILGATIIALRDLGTTVEEIHQQVDDFYMKPSE